MAEPGETATDAYTAMKLHALRMGLNSERVQDVVLFVRRNVGAKEARRYL